MRPLRTTVLAWLLTAVAATQAQTAALPTELSGRWTMASAGRTDLFSPDEITPASGSTFSAKLTWWTTNRSCRLHKEPIEGQVTATGIAFSARTKCDVALTAELHRGEKEWTGQAMVQGPNPVVVDMRAK